MTYTFIIPTLITLWGMTKAEAGTVRCSGQGFCHSVGRAIGAACPALIGFWSTHVSLGESIGGMTVACYALVVVAAWALPETRGRVLRLEAGAAT